MPHPQIPLKGLFGTVINSPPIRSAIDAQLLANAPPVPQKVGQSSGDVPGPQLPVNPPGLPPQPITQAPAPSSPGPAPAQAPTFEPQDARVTTQLETIVATDSPLLTRARTRTKQEFNRRGLLNSSMAVQAGEAATLDVALPIASQQASQIQQSNLAGGQIASTERLAGRQIASTEQISASGIAATERIAASNIAAFDREKATAAIAALNASYQQAFSTIGANENLPAATREKYLIHLAAIRDTNFNLIEQLYDISLVFESPVL